MIKFLWNLLTDWLTVNEYFRDKFSMKEMIDLFERNPPWTAVVGKTFPCPHLHQPILRVRQTSFGEDVYFYSFIFYLWKLYFSCRLREIDESGINYRKTLFFPSIGLLRTYRGKTFFSWLHLLRHQRRHQLRGHPQPRMTWSQEHFQVVRLEYWLLRLMFWR